MGVILAVLLLGMVVTATAYGQQVKLGGKVRTGQEVIVPRTENVAGNLVLAGGTIRVDGTVDGDVVAAGGSIDIAGTVTGDLLASGGQVQISGQVQGDARVAGGQVTVSGPVTGDLLLAAGQGTVSSAGTVGGDAMLVGGQVEIAGNVAGSILANAGSYRRTGTVGGTEDVKVPAQKKAPTLADRSLGFVRHYLSVLLVGALLLWAGRRLLLEPEWRVRRRPLQSLGLGLLALFVAGVLFVAVVLVVALLSIPLVLLGFGSLVGLLITAAIVTLAILGFLLYFVAAFGAPAIVGTAIGDLILWRRSEPVTARPWAALALGLLIVVLAMTVPVIGGWIAFLVYVVGSGAIVLWLWQSWRASRPSGTGPLVPAEQSAAPTASGTAAPGQ